MKRLWPIASLTVSSILLGVATWLYTRSGIVIDVDSSAWAILSALSTVGATLVALALALDAWRQRKDAAARLASAWVTEEYSFRPDESAYQRRIILHVANEGDQPGRVLPEYAETALAEPDESPMVGVTLDRSSARYRRR